MQKAWDIHQDFFENCILSERCAWHFGSIFSFSDRSPNGGRFSLVFYSTNAAHLKSVQYIHQDFLWYCKAYNTSSNPNCNWQLCVFLFLFCMCFVFSFEFRVRVFHLLFYCFAFIYFAFSLRMNLSWEPPAGYSIFYFTVLHLHYLFSFWKFQILFVFFLFFVLTSIFFSSGHRGPKHVL